MLFINGYKRDNSVILILRGEINFETTPKFKEAIVLLVGKGVFNIVIDLGSVTFIDSSGIGSLLAAKRMLNTAAGDIKLINVGQELQKVFRLTEVDRLVEIYDSVAEAEEHFFNKMEFSAAARSLISEQNKTKGEFIDFVPSNYLSRHSKILVFNLSRDITTNNISVILGIKNNYFVIDNPTYNGNNIDVAVGDVLLIRFDKGDWIYEFKSNVLRKKSARIPLIYADIPDKIEKRRKDNFFYVDCDLPVELEFCRIGQSNQKYVCRILSLSAGGAKIELTDFTEKAEGYVALRFYLYNTLLDSIVADIKNVLPADRENAKIIKAEFILIKESERISILRYANEILIRQKENK